MERILDLSKKYKIAFAGLIITAVVLLFLTNNQTIEESYKRLSWAIFLAGLIYTIAKVAIDYFSSVAYNELKDSTERNNAQQEELLKYQTKLNSITERFETNVIEYIDLYRDSQKTLTSIEKKLDNTNSNNEELKDRMKDIEHANNIIEKNVDKIWTLAKANANAITRLQKSK